MLLVRYRRDFDEVLIAVTPVLTGLILTVIRPIQPLLTRYNRRLLADMTGC